MIVILLSIERAIEVLIEVEVGFEVGLDRLWWWLSHITVDIGFFLFIMD